MTDEEREIIRRLHQRWVDQLQEQSAMLDDLREASQSLRVAIDRTARRQQAQEEMLQLIVDLLNLQDD